MTKRWEWIPLLFSALALVISTAALVTSQTLSRGGTIVVDVNDKTAEDAKAKQEVEEKVAAIAEAVSDRVSKDLATMVGGDAVKSYSLATSSKAEMNQAISMIQQAIQRHWQVTTTMAGKQCVVNVRMAADGLVLQVGDGSGDSAVCQAGILAVRKASPLPMPKNPELIKQIQNLNLTLKPRL